MNQDLKIFVCHTPGRESVMPQSSCFVHVLGGAALAGENTGNLVCDNTGDNISAKNKAYCELTVQYWAWKNADADYYGFCHYRRYFVLDGAKKQKPDIYANVEADYFDEGTLSLVTSDTDTIVRKMDGNPIALTTPFDVRNVSSRTIRDHYETFPSLHGKDVDILLDVIRDMAPQYENTAKEYLNGCLLYPCNMFIMEKKLFFQYCRWLFPILESCEHRIDTTYYSEEECRVIAHLAERCLGIFYTYHLQNEGATAVFFHRLFVRKPDVGIMPFPRSENPVTIVTASDDHFTPCMAVMIQSVLENTSPSNNYEIYILHTNIGKENQKKVMDLAGNYPHVYIGFYNMTMDVSPFDFKRSPWTWHLTGETYFRTLIHKIFAFYKKVLYLDGDIIAKSDVAGLFGTDIGNNLMGACLDGDIIGGCFMSGDTKNYVETVLGMPDPLKYFQAGVQLVNIEQFRKEFGDYELANRAVTNNYRYVDQDVFNVACHGKVFFIDSAWNVLVQHKGDRIAMIKKAPAHISRQYFEAREYPRIIHYAGAQKPWFDPEMDFAKDFWDVARRSSFYETILLRLCHYRPVISQNKFVVKKIALSFFPPGSRRRNMIRKIYYRFKK